MITYLAHIYIYLVPFLDVRLQTFLGFDLEILSSESLEVKTFLVIRSHAWLPI